MNKYIIGILGLMSFAVMAMLGVAEAASYASLDEVPAGGGELRLVDAESIPAQEGERVIAFPLKRTDVSARIDGPMIQVEVDQEFENAFDQPIEAVYVFPLSHDAAVNGYEIIIGDRVITGRIAEREEAREVYETARDEGHTAGLLEEQSANVFVQSIANIAPGESVRVRFRYVELLKYDQYEGYEWVFPMTITPRYLPEGSSGRRTVGGGGGASGDVDVSYVDSTDHRVSIQIKGEAGVPIQEISSPSHGIVPQVSGSAFEVQLDEETVPNRDFILRHRTAGQDSKVALMAHRDDLGGYFTLLVQPKQSFTEQDVTPKEVIILFDRSGSMGGEPIARAQAVGRAVLNNLLPHDTFNIITFASDADQFEGRPVLATASNIQRAQAYLAGLRAAGGTELNAGIEAALGEPAEGERVRMVYLLTDGGAGNDEQVLAAIRVPKGNNRIFPVGISDSPNRYLIDRLALEGRGFATYIDLFEDPAPTINRLIQRTAWPYLTDIQVDWSGLDVSEVTPAFIPDVFAGQPLVVSGRFGTPGAANITISGRRAGQAFELRLPVVLPDTEPRQPVAYLWANRRIDELLASQYRGEQPEVVAEVTRLGLKFGLVTPYTSYVAVDDETVVSGSSVTVEQPSARPSGYGGSRPSSSGRGSSYSGWSGYDDDDSSGGDLDGLSVILGLALLGLVACRRRRLI